MLSATMFIGGLGLAGYYGEAWYRAPTYSEDEIARSVEFNLQADLARLGPQLKPEGEKLEQLRAIVRAEVEAEVTRETRDAQRWFSIGLIAIVFGLGHMLFLRINERRNR
jgi:hypothetical protein